LPELPSAKMALRMPTNMPRLDPLVFAFFFLQDLGAPAENLADFVFEQVEGEPIADRRYASDSRVSS
jgi:hypothetical protein